MVTAAVQAVIVAASGSVALLGDTLHNFADALTAVPLAIAFSLGRPRRQPPLHLRVRPRGDLAGIVIVLLITASAALAGYEAVRRLLDPQEIRAVGWVAAAAVIGFAGNDVGGPLPHQGRQGDRLGRAGGRRDCTPGTDGFTSLAVLLGAGRRRARLPRGRPHRRPAHHGRHRVRPA
ncbi:hypothetical protein GCM10020220_000590 [Nonomuraea rubra]|uniref:cation transporter n=1 Tax=Nonomuraea rubra TaxID=46180 RepID=UPI0031ECC80E